MIAWSSGLARIRRLSTLTSHGYRGTWRPTEQIPERIIGSPVCTDRFCSPNPTATGETTRFVVNARLSGANWRANAYAEFYDWNMFSNPEYAADDGNSAQIYQLDDRIELYAGWGRGSSSTGCRSPRPGGG